MRSFLLTLVLGLGAMGLSLTVPNQARADDGRNPAIRSGTTMPVAYWGGRLGWRGYPGYGYGFNRGYYPYGYGFYGNYGYRSYYPGYWGGYGGYYRPYRGFYRRGFYW